MSNRPNAGNKQHRTLIYSSILLAVVLAFYAAFLLLWATHYTLYIAIMNALGVDAWRFPFLDAMAVLSWIDCHQHGINVFVLNPCDPLHRLMNYSPIILDVPTFGIGVRNTFAVGLAIDFAFLATLPFVFRPASLKALILAGIACLSPTVLFAVERGNFDVLVFALIGVGCLFGLRRGAGRFTSYAIFAIGGLLKFYAFVLLALSARERPRAFAVVAALGAAVILAFAGHYWSELRRAVTAQPAFVFWGDTFTARQLPFGIADRFHLSPGTGVFLLLLLLAAFAYLALRLAGLMRSSVSEADWWRSESYFFGAGSLLIVGCFFSGVNVGYRAITLLFVLPWLFERSSSVQGRALKHILTATLWMVLFLLWKDFFRHGVDIILGQILGQPNPRQPKAFSGDWPRVGFFILRELVWWWVVAVFVAFAGLFLWQSPLSRALIGERRGRLSVEA